VSHRSDWSGEDEEVAENLQLELRWELVEFRDRQRDRGLGRGKLMERTGHDLSVAAMLYGRHVAVVGRQYFSVQKSDDARGQSSIARSEGEDLEIFG
jgi:hypothetical protein